MLKQIIAVAVFLIAAVAFCEAATINAKSCSQADVQSAINSANIGDTIIVPAGSCIWSIPVTWTKPLTVKGADCTLDADGLPISCPVNIMANRAVLFDMNGGSGDFRLAHFGISGNGGPKAPQDNFLLSFGGTANNGFGGGIWNSLRVDHLKFTHDAPGEYAVQIGSWIAFDQSSTQDIKALFDHISYTAKTSSMFIKIWGSNGAWKADDNFGTDKAIYIEDSKFTWTGTTRWIVDTECGARFVFRYNKVSGGLIGMHDTGSTQGCRGNRLSEQYNNIFSDCTIAECSNWGALGFRGGTGVLYNNKIGSGYWTPFTQQVWSGYGGVSGVCDRGSRLRWNYLGDSMGCCDNVNERICSTFSPHCASTGNRCSGTWDCADCKLRCSSNAECGTGNTCLTRMDNVDGLNDPSGWPCRDQNGRGKDSVDHATQAYVPTYLWSNTDGNNNLIKMDESYYNDHFLKPGRDYINSAMPKPGYTPYTYPHPLQNGGSAQEVCGNGKCLAAETCLSCPADCSTIEGDLNCDKKVDILDLVLVAQNYGKTSGFDTKADANKDGKVDIFDLVIVAQNYGESAGGAPGAQSPIAPGGVAS